MGMGLNKEVHLLNNLRKNILEMSYLNNSGHIPSALSMLDYSYWLFKESYIDILKDRLVIGKPYGSQAYYAIYAELGFIQKEDILSFGKTDHYLTHGITTSLPGVVFSEDTLASSVGVACGIALSLKNKQSEKKVYINISDASIQAGTIWEALMFADIHNLSNIYMTIDYNQLQVLNKLEGLSNIYQKINSFGWEVFETEGHIKNNIIQGLDFLFKNRPMKKPGVLIFHTIKGKGISFMENNLDWHYKTLDEFYYKKALKELD